MQTPGRSLQTRLRLHSLQCFIRICSKEASPCIDELLIDLLASLRCCVDRQRDLDKYYGFQLVSSQYPTP
jgi:hypothetical protein